MPLNYTVRRVRRTALAAAGLTVIALSISFYAYGYPFGINHTTQKDQGVAGEGQGCWCHNVNSSTNTHVSITSDQTTFEPNATYTLRVTVANATEKFAGFNIAAKYGTLAVAESGTQLMDGELTHSTPRSLTAGSSTWTFRYTAPTDVAFDTIYATGNAVNGNGTNDAGDQWNWSPKFVVQIATAGVAASAIMPAHISVWPNPTAGVLHVDGGVSGPVQYRVLDLAGKTVLTGEGSSRFDVSTSGLASGAYDLQVFEQGHLRSTGRFVVR